MLPVCEPDSRIHCDAVAALPRRQFHYGLVEVSGNGQLAVRPLLNPFPPAIKRVLLPLSILQEPIRGYRFRKALHSFGHGSACSTSLSLASLGTLT
jgi:hypothetical protein